MRSTIFIKSNQFIYFADDMDIIDRAFEAVLLKKGISPTVTSGVGSCCCA